MKRKTSRNRNIFWSFFFFFGVDKKREEIYSRKKKIMKERISLERKNYENVSKTKTVCFGKNRICLFVHFFILFGFFILVIALLAILEIFERIDSFSKYTKCAILCKRNRHFYGNLRDFIFFLSLVFTSLGISLGNEFTKGRN